VPPIELTEYGESRLAPLTEAQAQALAASKLVTPVRTADVGWWELKPGGAVGAVRVGGLDVRVAPKVDIDRIVFMLGYRLRGITWQDAVVPVEAAPDVVHVLAEVFTRAVAEAVRPGLLQGYRVAEESLPVVRGRIRIDEQLKRRPGLWVPIEVTFDDFTVDTAENQVLRAALERLQRNPLVPVEVRRRMSGLLLQFAEVSRLVPGAGLPTWRITRLNRRYETALELARLVLSSSSFEHHVGTVPVDGFVLDLPTIYEHFVTDALADALRPLAPGSRVQGQFQGTLDTKGEVELKPDIVWLDPREQPIAVADAKYKAEKVSGFPNPDVYQALAYATVLGLPDAHLIYAKGNAPVTTYDVRHSPIRVHAHVLDLAQSPPDLLSQVADLAARIHGWAG
jgi:5-methylcytosine-specific restriction enzyme subunit McrC